jgi:hypothetical protein
MDPARVRNKLPNAEWEWDISSLVSPDHFLRKPERRLYPKRGLASAEVKTNNPIRRKPAD